MSNETPILFTIINGAVVPVQSLTIGTSGININQGSGIESVVEGANIDVDDTDPSNPVISAT